MLSEVQQQELRQAFERMPAEAFVGIAQEAVRLHGEDAQAWFLLGAGLHRLGRVEEALQAFARTTVLDPRHVQASNAQAGLLASMGRGAEARSVLEAARQRFPSDPTILVNLGYLLEQQVEGREQALGCYDEALRLDVANRAALMNRGYLLTLMGRLPEAVENNRRFVAAHPQFATAHFNLAESLLASRQLQEADGAASRALEIDAHLLAARVTRIFARAMAANLSPAQQDLDWIRANVPSLFDDIKRRLYGTVDEKLEHADARSIYLHLLYNAIQDCDWSRWDEFVEAFGRLVLEAAGTKDEIRDATLPFVALSFPIGNEARLRLAQGVARGLREKVGPRQRPPAQYKTDGRIRLGYVSADFRHHPGGYLMRRLFALHDRSRFEIYGYALDEDDGSDVRRDIRSGCDVFREFAGMGVETIVEAIRSDHLDIVVDRSVYTKLARPEIFASGVAPLQVGYLGYAGTSGGDSLDYVIVDGVVCPEGDDRWWSEKLVRLPHCYFVTNDREVIASGTQHRSKLGLPDSAVVYCCFNNPYKFEPRTFATWMRILWRVPGSVLWLLDTGPSMRSNLRREASALGVDPDRILFTSFLRDHAAHLERYRFADVFLDTGYCNAHTTAVDALWCGVPVLTVSGDTIVSRVAASLLQASGLPDLICVDWAEYEERAVFLGKAADNLRALKERVTRSTSSGRLFETLRFARELEAAFESMWIRHLDGLPPTPFNVAASPPTRHG